MVRSIINNIISWKILPGIFGKIDKIASAGNAISETPYDLPQVQRQHFIIIITESIDYSTATEFSLIVAAPKLANLTSGSSPYTHLS